MAKVRHLQHAPIIEAVIDIMAEVDAFPENNEELISFANNFEPHTSKSHEVLQEFEAKFNVSKDLEPNPDIKISKPSGIRLTMNENKEILILKKTGMSFSRLSPYQNWEEAYEKASFYWNKYQNAFKILKAKRLALRYINRVMLPMTTGASYKDFLTVGPILPKDLPPYVSNYFNRIIIEDPKTKIAASLVQAIEQPLPNNDVPYILDVDAFMLGEFDPKVLEDKFLKLREFKNFVFFSHITEKLVDHIER